MAAEIALMVGYAAALRFLKTESEEQRSLLHAIARGAREVQRRHDLERAGQIAEQVLRGLGAIK